MRWDEIRPRLDAYIDGGVRLTTPRFSGRVSPCRYGRPLNWLPASRLLPRAAGWSAATLCIAAGAPPLASERLELYHRAITRLLANMLALADRSALVSWAAENQPSALP